MRRRKALHDARRRRCVHPTGGAARIHRCLPGACAALLLLPVISTAGASTLELGGHTKLNVTHQSYPTDSLFREIDGPRSTDVQGDLRLTPDWRYRGWTLDVDYQLVGQHRDSAIAAVGSLPAAAFAGVPDDRRRWFDLTSVLDDSADNTILHRLDRLSIGWASEHVVVKFGRQALSWGNGLFYTPMDLVNPFDPAAVDTEYKAGDDMLYLQVLRGNGDDVQAAVVVRRDPSSGNVEARESTTALKYHGFASDWEFDLLLAESYDDTIVGIGAGRSLGGARWSADVVVTDSSDGGFVQIVTNLSYSWIAFERNMTGVLEYHFNGAGQGDDPYSPDSLSGRPELLARLQRGQSFTLGRHALAGNVMVEVTPLWNVSTLLLANPGDPSALLQVTSSYSLSDNLTWLASLNLPIGADGTEFGGIDSGIQGRYLSTSVGLFAQIAWYF